MVNTKSALVEQCRDLSYCRKLFISSDHFQTVSSTIFGHLRTAAAYFWAGPNTCLGVALGWLLGGHFNVVDGVIEIHGDRIAQGLNQLWQPAIALTLGHCVLGQTSAALDITRAHERVHVRQYERWGPLFIPAYLAAWAYLSCRGRDGYRENPFEVEAYRISG